MRWGTFLLLLCPAGLAAHVVDVYPVEAVLKADPGVLRVTVRANLTDWRFMATGEVPEGPWPEALRTAAENYLAAHFPVSADGRPVPPRVLGGRSVRPLWSSARREDVLLRVVYELPVGTRVVALAPRFFIEDWRAIEGSGRRAPPGVRRDFRTLLAWSPGSEGKAWRTLEDPPLEISWDRLARSFPRRAGESAAAGVAFLVSTGGGPALLAALALFPPSRRWALAGTAVALLALAAGAFRGPEAEQAGRLLWLAVALGGGLSLGRATGLGWSLAAAAGAFALGALGVDGGAAYRAETGFTHFSFPSFWVGVLAAALLAWAARPALGAFYRLHFRSHTEGELERLALFHRRMVSRAIGLFALYWLLRPVWS